MDTVKDKTLIMIVGPAAIGKSSLMNEVVNLDERFGRVSGFTTRKPRSNDEPGMYRYLSTTEAERLIADHDLVQYAVHPTTGAIYGSQAIDYPATYNMLDTLSNVVDELRELPFAQTITISMTTDPDAWVAWLLERYPVPSHERTKRLNEALLSIEWSLSQTKNHYWLVNHPNDIHSTALELIAIANQTSLTTSTPPQAKKMQKQVKDLLSYKQKEVI